MKDCFAITLQAEGPGPPAEQRVKRLLKLAKRACGLRAIDVAPAAASGPSGGGKKRTLTRELPQHKRPGFCSVKGIHRQVLKAIDAEISYWNAPERDQESFGQPRATQYEMAIAVADAREGITPYRPREWLGRELTTADRKAVSLAVADLEAAGFLERLVGDSGSRTVSVQLLALPVDWSR